VGEVYGEFVHDAACADGARLSRTCGSRLELIRTTIQSRFSKLTA
jgi:hypothetical protein